MLVVSYERRNSVIDVCVRTTYIVVYVLNAIILSGFKHFINQKPDSSVLFFM